MPAYFEAGKGSLQRPEDHKKFSDNWDLIFGKKKDPEREKFIEEVFNAIPVVNIPTAITDVSDESATIETNISDQNPNKPRLAGWWKEKTEKVEPKNIGVCPDCKGWGCWTCCTSEQQIRSCQGTFG